MPFSAMTATELREYLGAYFRNRLPTQSTAPGSDNAKRLTVVAGAAALTHRHVAAVRSALSPLHAEGADLTELLEQFGLQRGGPTPARGTAAGRVRGSTGSAYATTDVLVHQVTGLRFRPGTAGTVPGSGEVDVDIAAIDTGPATRLEAGEVLVWQVPPPGLQPDVELQRPLDQGGDAEEPTGSARQRLLARLAGRPEGGNGRDWQTWVAAGGAAGVYLYPHRNGVGSVDVAALWAGSGAARLLSVGERSVLSDALAPLRPITGSHRVLEVVEDAQIARITITPRADVVYARDWQDTTPPVVAAYTPGSRVLQFSAARPVDIRPQSRLVWDGAGGEGPHVVQALVGGDSVTLQAEPTTAPVAGQSVYAGGPLTAPVIAAMRAMVDELGPALGEFGGDWHDGLRRDAITAAVFAVPGIFAVSITTPTTNYTPPDYGYPTDGQVPLVTLQRVLVRYG